MLVRDSYVSKEEVNIDIGEVSFLAVGLLTAGIKPARCVETRLSPHNPG